jgi:hypothetical protein
MLTLKHQFLKVKWALEILLACWSPHIMVITVSVANMCSNYAYSSRCLWMVVDSDNHLAGHTTLDFFVLICMLIGWT